MSKEIYMRNRQMDYIALVVFIVIELAGLIIMGLTGTAAGRIVGGIFLCGGWLYLFLVNYYNENN